METRPLGRSGLSVSAIGLGTWPMSGDRAGIAYGPTDDEESVRAIRRALDLGCTFFDTSDMYGHGHAERLLGRALEGVRDRVILATKGGFDIESEKPRYDFSPAHLRRALAASLDRLGTDRADVYFLHNPSVADLRGGEAIGALREFQREGRVRAVGASVLADDAGFAALEQGVDVLQVAFHIVRAAPALRLIEEAAGRGVGVVAREPLANGFLSGKFRVGVSFGPTDFRSRIPPDEVARRLRLVEKLRFLARQGRTLAQAAIQFVLACEGVSVTIPGAKTVAQVEENVGALSAPPLTGRDLEGIFEAAAGCYEAD